ncbi:hypothetical protein HMPREF1583_01157 [Gardnerella vaginalis JCP8151B]|nr:hypothetical protein HMPREF1583_01157 [Gardnerella vaginalis JCP8151B]
MWLRAYATIRSAMIRTRMLFDVAIWHTRERWRCKPPKHSTASIPSRVLSHDF